MKSYHLSRDFNVTHDSFGGNQMWYPEIRQVKTGCGPVALANLYAWHRGLSLDNEEMTRLMLAVLHHLKGPVIHPLSFIRGARSLFEARGFDLEASYLLLIRRTPEKRAKLLDLIRESLSEDRPLPLLMGPNRKKDEGYRRDFHTHWVLITGMDLIDDKIILEVSSWGKSFNLDLDRLADSKWFLSVLSITPLEGS